MVKTQPKRRVNGLRTTKPRFAQRELWESLEPPVEVAEAIRTLAALRERFERALELERADA